MAKKRPENMEFTLRNRNRNRLLVALTGWAVSADVLRPMLGRVLLASPEGECSPKPTQGDTSHAASQSPSAIRIYNSRYARPSVMSKYRFAAIPYAKSGTYMHGYDVLGASEKGEKFLPWILSCCCTVCATRAKYMFLFALQHLIAC